VRVLRLFEHAFEISDADEAATSAGDPGGRDIPPQPSRSQIQNLQSALTPARAITRFA